MATQSSLTIHPHPPEEAKPGASLKEDPLQDLSLSAGTKADTDSDYAQELSEEEEEEDYADSDFSSPPKKASNRVATRLEPRARVDTAMTRKLRPVRGIGEAHALLPPDETEEKVPQESVEIEKEEPEEEVCLSEPEYTRELSEDEAGKQLCEIQGMWEMTAVLDFLRVFENVLKLKLDFTAESLEDAIVRSPGQGILANVHMALMLSMTPRSQITEHTWTCFLASKLYAQFIREGSSAFLNFFPRKGHESEDYASLPSSERVKALKSLCELCGDHEIIRNLFDSILRPGKAKGQKGKTNARSKAENYCIDDFRRVPYGEGMNSEKYWYLDMWEQAGVRMYKEVERGVSQQGSQKGAIIESGKYRGWPKSMFVGRKKKGGKAQRKDPVFVEDSPCGQWTIVASNYEDFETLSSTLGSSKKRKSITLGKRIRGEIMAELQQREMAQQKRQKAAEKLKVRLGDVIIDTSGRFGRSQRKRKEISYRFDAYDQLIEDSILASGIHEEKEGDGLTPEVGAGGNRFVHKGSSSRLRISQTKPLLDIEEVPSSDDQSPEDIHMGECELSLNRSCKCPEDADLTNADLPTGRQIDVSSHALHEMRNGLSNSPEGCNLSAVIQQDCGDFSDTHMPSTKSKRVILINGQKCETGEPVPSLGKANDDIELVDESSGGSMDALSSEGY